MVHLSLVRSSHGVRASDAFVSPGPGSTYTSMPVRSQARVLSCNSMAPPATQPLPTCVHLETVRRDSVGSSRRHSTYAVPSQCRVSDTLDRFVLGGPVVQASSPTRSLARAVLRLPSLASRHRLSHPRVQVIAVLSYPPPWSGIMRWGVFCRRCRWSRLWPCLSTWSMFFSSASPSPLCGCERYLGSASLEISLSLAS